MNIIFKPECKTEIIEPSYDLPIIGEPISKTGASATNSNAYGVIVDIIGDGSSRRVRVMTEGYIDYDKVKDNYMEYTDEAINALTGITLCSGGKFPTGGSVPKPLTYDYMPEGYPTKAMGTDTVMEEQVVEFVSSGDGSPSVGSLTTTFTPVEGQTYIVNWDGTEHECVCSIFNGRFLVLGNLSIIGAGDDSGEPFIYLNAPARSEFETLDTAASHTISVKKTGGVVTPIAEEFLPVASEDNYGAVKKSEIVTSYNFDVHAPHDQMVEAITAFKTGNASIVWDGRKIIYAAYNSSTDTISIIFSYWPTALYIYSNVNGFYIESLRTPKEWSELILPSSTSGSTKKFRITVDDSGTITATEVS